MSASRKFHTQELALYGVLIALSLVFGYVEALIPLPFVVPGVKLGLGNIVVLFALVSFGARPAFLMMLVKVLASSILFGNASIFMYSLAGGILAYCAMLLLVRYIKTSLLTVSVMGALFHNVGQLIVVAYVFNYVIVFSVLPVLLISALVTGTITGQICKLALQALPAYLSRSK